MRYRDGRRSLCLSSQSGCPLTCTFCATGQMRFGRNLTASEILDQALHFRRLGSRRPRRVHGDGRADDEPRRGARGLPAAARARDQPPPHRDLDGRLDPGHRAAGRASPMPIRLALSLHAADDALRSELMPVNDRYPLADVLAACRSYYERKRRMVFVEYVMLAGVNDSFVQAAPAGRGARPPHLQGQPDPLQPDRLALRGLEPEGDRGVPRPSSSATGIGATVRLTRGPRHRRRLRAAGRAPSGAAPARRGRDAIRAGG